MRITFEDFALAQEICSAVLDAYVEEKLYDAIDDARAEAGTMDIDTHMVKNDARVLDHCRIILPADLALRKKLMESQAAQ